MKSVLVLATLLVLTPAALAGSVRTVTAPAPVLAVGFDGSRVAYAVGRSASDCNRVYVWNLATRGVSKLGRKTHCVQTSTGNAIAEVSIAGTRVLWVHYVGGNQRDWSLWTATTGRPAPIRLRAASVDADAPAPLLVGHGVSTGGGLLPYAAGRLVIGLRSSGARRFAWTAPAPVRDLTASGGRVAVATEGSKVTVLDTQGRVVRIETYTAEVDRVRIAGTLLAVQHGRRLEVGDQSWTLPAGARIEDATADAVFYVASGRGYRLSLGSGGRTSLGAVAHLQAGGARLATSSGRGVSVRPLPRAG